MADPVWFWMDVVSPHMAGLAQALAIQGQNVTYVAEQEMSPRRAGAGWTVPDLGAATLHLAPNVSAIRHFVDVAPAESVHICMGLRGNGLVGEAWRTLAMRRLRQWVVLETVDDSGWLGALKRLEYRRLVHKWHDRIEGILAIGHDTPLWLVKRGMPADRVFPFAYFLADRGIVIMPSYNSRMPFRFLFVGQFIERKRIDLLLDALGRLGDAAFELAVVGSGSLESVLRSSAEEKLPGRVHWLGQRSIGEIPALMAAADCLVLPSRHDGWGAVVSEALMAGTPAICSNACGAAGPVRASGYGGVFPAGNVDALASLLAAALNRGRLTLDQRAALANWAVCLGAKEGARYLSFLLDGATRAGTRAVPPWIVKC